jgi:hypothetical protein
MRNFQHSGRCEVDQFVGVFLDRNAAVIQNYMYTSK